ncbi:FecR family protein [Dyadobacter psychrotolerans]|uniref:DUF4974 domain-containing protein n=1 Tax=Dyadobacter psychrotolerans TaxID=2541721 RepID=A0A4V6PFU6_9BACT|nr:FecR domain-containing protein [Dyadobacter psychrotolerans]TDE16608.1 DUF4974 domain-containing protein [Dyadobacter psychrotolerans]
MNTSHENIPEELLTRYLSKTATDEEIIQVENWIAKSPENKQEFTDYQYIWNTTKSIHDKINVDTNAAWNKVRSKMDERQIPKNHFPNTEKQNLQYSRKLPVALWMAAAISLVIMASGLFLFLRKNSDSQYLQVATTTQTIEKILPDGSKVFLNYNSTLTYPENFDGDLRSVSLQGEAFFDVKPDTAHPFIIHANGTEVKVLGTSFNVKAYDKKPVRVDVATGKVEVKKADSKILLTKGESAEVLSDTVKSIIPDLNILGYKTKIFDFHATNLKDVVSSIRSGYHIDLRLSNTRLAQCRLTIRFEKEPVDATLSVIAETLDLTVRKEGQTYWLEGSGCQP